ncbi:hypothetical protein NDU88_002442 [Pleurodeles waltl]|uniref:Uncharacterized protein n=1 Tax=Pleurodeles waltl TaxID=8319 RepID=A0AAV7U9R0_PLEWA|nr:hypothetical protein NDU88_002442 [Pleurodeles waltl]
MEAGTAGDHPAPSETPSTPAAYPRPRLPRRPLGLLPARMRTHIRRAGAELSPGQPGAAAGAETPLRARVSRGAQCAAEEEPGRADGGGSRPQESGQHLSRAGIGPPSSPHTPGYSKKNLSQGEVGGTRTHQDWRGPPSQVHPELKEALQGAEALGPLSSVKARGAGNFIIGA